MPQEFDVAARVTAALGSRSIIDDVLVRLADRVCLRVIADGQVLAVKVDATSERSAREVATLREAGARDVAVPRIVRHDLTPPPLLALEWVDGRALSDDPRQWPEAGDQLRRLHNARPPDGMRRFDHREATWRDFLVWWTKHETALCEQNGALQPAESELMRTGLLSCLATMPEPERTLLHGDLQPDHVLIERVTGEPVIIDWGDAGTGDPLWDLAVLLLDHPQHRDRVLEGYQPNSRLRRHVDAHLDAYRLIRYLGEITWLLARNFDATSSIAGARHLAASVIPSFKIR